MDPSGIVLRAVGLAPELLCADLAPEEWITLTQRDAPIWLHAVATDHAEAMALFVGRLGFHELAVEDALSADERPSTQEFEDCLFTVAPVLVGHDPSKSSEVAFFLRRGSLVTITTSPCPTVDLWIDRIAKKEGNRKWLPYHLLHALVDAIVDDYFPALDALEDEVDELADAIFAGDTTRVADLLKLKRKTIDYRRRLGPLRDVLNGVLRHDLELIPDDARPYFADVYDHAMRLTELLEIHRETLASLLDVHLSMVSNNLNQVVKQMTVLSTVLMAMALIAGIYGMNFKHMPELAMVWGYPFALGLMLVVSLIIVGIFRRIKWI